MTKEDIITLPNPHLRQKSQRVGFISDEIKQLILAMEAATISWDESRDHEVGVALAAIQIDSLFKVIVMRNDYDNKEDRTFTAFINPEITKFEGKIVEDYEGCLSVPTVYGKVPRYSKVRVRATGIDGKKISVTANGFLARIFQHEIDHTNGIVFIDHIKDDPDAFYILNEAGELDKLNYETDVAHSTILW
jgi:peptide deformylase